MSNGPRPATPDADFDEIRRAFVADGPDRLPKDARLRATRRVQGALWMAALDPKPPPRLHLLRRQSLWTMDDVPARRRPFWIGVANLPLLGPAPTDEDALARAAAWHLERALGRTARRRADLLSLAAAEAAIGRGLDRWSLDLADLTLSEGGLAGLFGRRRGPPVLPLDRLPDGWLAEAGLLLSAEREGLRGGHERLSPRRFLQGGVPGSAHARQAARLRLRRLLQAEGIADDLLKHNEGD